MTTIKVTAVQNGNFSKPLLVHVNRINFQSTAKEEQIIYFRLPFSFKYQSLEKLKDSDLFLVDCNMQYKIINFVKKTEEIVQNKSQVKIQKNEIKIKNATKEGFIQIQGTVINEANQSDIFADISLKNIQGYEKYYEYRKKYKTLENITRKINFSLDHRLKLICETLNFKQEFFFTLDELKDKEMKNWYIELTSKTKLTFQFQQIISIGDTNIENKIQQGSFDIGELSSNNSYNIVLEMSQYLKITLSMKVVKNKNLSKYQFVSLRVLETSQTNQTLKIGNEENINSPSAVQINPLIDGKFFDYEYGYLSQNLSEFKKMGQQQEIHNYLSKLTSSKQKYQHFINQKVIDLSQSKNLVFSIKNYSIQIPVAYVLEGYNCFMDQNWQIKFILEIVDTDKVKSKQQQHETSYIKFQAIPRKLFELNIKDIVNIGQVIDIIQKTLLSNEKSFFFKIKCESTIYTIEFQISTVKKADFKKQAKQLQLKTQYSQFNEGNFVLLKQADIKENFHMIKSLNLQPFYLIEITDSSSVSFDISTSKDVIMHGQITKSELYFQGEQLDKNIILSPNGQGSQQEKSKFLNELRDPPIISRSSTALQLPNQVNNHQFITVTLNTILDLQILRIQDEDPKKRKTKTEKNKLGEKVQLQVQDEFNSDRIKQFSMNRSCFIQKNVNLKLGIKLKRRHYDVDLNSFDNSQLIGKTLLLNRNSKDKVTQAQGTLQLELPPHHFREFQFEAYDENINNKVSLKLEIYCSKQPFSIGDQHVYRVKIPHIFWKMNNLKVQNQQEPKISIQTFLSNKKKKTEPKEIIFNSGQEISLPHFNHSDGISVKICHQNGFQDIGYSKIRDCIKAKYQVIKDEIRWNEESQWFLASLTLKNSSFYFLIKMQFDPNAQRDSSNSSRTTQKTKSKQKKETSNEKGGPDILAKTLKSQDAITKLKISKNNLFEELKQLTSKYVQRESMITYLKKKIIQIEEENRRKKQEMKYALQTSKNKSKNKISNQQQGKNSVYRTICECGERGHDNIRWGYCEKCIEKLRQRYETFLKEYQEKSSDYEKAMFKKFTLRDKIDMIKGRIQGYKNIMKGNEQGENQFRTPLQIENAYQKMQEKQLALQLQELKLEVFDLERQRDSQFERRSYQMSELQRKIKKQEDSLWQKSQQLNALNLKLKQIQEQIKSNEQKRNENFD